MVLIPHIILANKSPNVVAPEEFADKPLMWRATPNGYIDGKYMKEYAGRLRQAVGHNRPILLIMDGHKAHLTAVVLAEFSRLDIHVYIIPSHTSHGLAPCDQFNFMIHRRRAFHEHGFFHDGLIYNNANLRLVALGLAALDCYTYNRLVISAWQRAGISQDIQSAELLANKPRETVVATIDSEPQAATAALPDCFAAPSASATAEELRQQMIAMTEAYNQLQQSLHHRYTETFATQEAEITGRLKHAQAQLEMRGKSRVSVKPSLFGDVTSAEFHAAVVKNHAKKKTAVQQAAAKVAKESYEAPVIKKIIEVDFIDEPAEATVEKLREILHQLRLPKYGKR